MPTTRFAPSPTGYLHLGHAAAALAAHEAAGPCGRALLRIEDIDPARCRPEYESALLEDLAWLGLVYAAPPRRQSDHLEEYAAALATLREAGLVYPCFCTRAEITRELAAAAAAAHGPEGPPYPGTCRRLDPARRAKRLARNDPHAWRLDMQAALRRTGPLTWHEQGEGRLQADPAPFGDVVLGRKDIPASYHLCVTHDDALQGVTLVTRAADLRPATAIHRLLQTLMGWPEPAYAHHPLLLGPDGKRLSKRNAAPALRAMREAGLSPRDVLAQARITPSPAAPSGTPPGPTPHTPRS